MRIGMGVHNPPCRAATHARLVGRAGRQLPGALPRHLPPCPDPPGCLARASLGCPCPVARHVMGGCLPRAPNPPVGITLPLGQRGPALAGRPGGAARTTPVGVTPGTPPRSPWCPHPVVWCAQGGCLPPSQPPVALKGGVPLQMTLYLLIQAVTAGKAKMHLVAIQLDDQGQPWETCRLALAAWSLRLITQTG